MYSFFVNGCQVSTSKKQSLLRFLRDEMHLTSVKDGCSQGACGACTVLIDGETCKACVPQTDRLEGRSIITVGGPVNGNQRFTRMLTVRPELFSAVSVFRVWSCVPRDCLTAIRIRRKRRLNMRFAITIAAVLAM